MQEVGAKAVQPGFSAACERNKEPIREVLRTVLSDGQAVLEVGSGTGQHAVFFGGCFPGVRWQPSDTGEYLPGLHARLSTEAPANVAQALELNVRMQPWPVAWVDVVFSANTLHFMSTDCVAEFFRGVGQVLRPGGHLLVYGPFNYGGAFTSPSNEEFERWLKSRDPLLGIRDFEWVQELAERHSLLLISDAAMPANNRCLLWRKVTSV